MRNNLSNNVSIAIVFLSVVAGSCAIVYTISHATHEPQPVPASWKTISCDPTIYDGLLVKILIEGSQSGDHQLELVYRKFANQPPVLVCRLKRPIGTEDKYLVGKVYYNRETNKVYVIDCVPVK